MVTVVRKSALPTQAEVPERLHEAAQAATSISLREPRPVGFPLFFTDSMEIIEPVVAFLHEHAVQRAHTADTVRTYAEILFDWFDTLEQSSIAWDNADGADLVAYRNRMLTQPSPQTGRSYSIRTINHRVRGVLRFYSWTVRHGWLKTSPLAEPSTTDFVVSHRERWRYSKSPDRGIFLLRQFESLPQPLNPAQARELLAQLAPPYDLMARWQLYTGLRVSELLRLTLHDILKHRAARRPDSRATHHTVRLMRKGRKHGYVIASESLFAETDSYVELHRAAWLHRSSRRGFPQVESPLFVGPRGRTVSKNTYQQVVRLAAERCGFAATTHQLRATFACMMLARLEQLAKTGEPINPLLIVKVLMGHEHIDTTDRYLRAVAVDTHVLADVLEFSAAHSGRAMRRRQRMQRALPQSGRVSASSARHVPLDEPRRVRKTTIDFRTLGLPKDVRYALADAFWNHVGPRGATATHLQWCHLRCFGRFVAQTQSVQRLDDLDRALLLRYVEWLGQQRSTFSGEPLSKSSRSVAYTVLRKLLQWLERCRPGLIKPINYPFNPFPGRRREARPRGRLPIEELRAILRACEKDIEQSRAFRARIAEERRSARISKPSPQASRGALLEYIDAHCGGIVPGCRSTDFWRIGRALAAHGGFRQIAPGLYPTSDALMPYYIAILIHTAGNPHAIAALRTDCLRPMPLLDDREMLVWEKPRASRLQRRSFRREAPLDPPVLVRELLEWTSRLRRRVAPTLRTRLFLYHGQNGITALAPTTLIYPRRRFAERHQLPDFELAAFRPSVLTAFYRAYGDLQQVRSIANHAYLSTSASYVESPEVQAENRARVATLQNAFIGHVREPAAVRALGLPIEGTARRGIFPAGEAVSMFGFSCLDPFAGVAPGTRPGELCTNFLGCLTCSNAILTHDAPTLARLLQARDHLRAASSQIHPARWAAIYAPQLAILEHDILARFSSDEIAEAQRLQRALTSLPPLQ